ncbi:MAG: NAD-dependent epimerase/dehydratase family protein [Thermodesulfobacteriota bacterium]
MKALVTGGGGFLGQALATRLVGRGDEVVSLTRGDYPELRTLGVQVRRGDVADPEAVSAAAAGCDVVFHTAAKAEMWGPYESFHRTNVLGTRNVIEACRRHGISRLVHTSSPSVVYRGRSQRGVGEDEPYPDRFLAHYPRTKAEAEKLVLAANDERLATVALRPHLIWGPGDNHIVPRLVEKGRAGKLRLISGGPYLVDSVYIDNAAEAHLLAADRLTPDSPPAGRAYFISNGEPLDIVELINKIIGAAGVPPVTPTVPPWAADAAGTICETIWGIFRLKTEPPLTRFLARQFSTDHWFDLSAAKRDLGYEPKVTIEAGLRKLAEHLASNVH